MSVFFSIAPVSRNISRRVTSQSRWKGRARWCAGAAFIALACAPVGAQLTINANFTTPNTTDFPGSTPIANLSNAAAVENTIDQAIAQVTGLISTPLTLNINFVNTPTGLGASVDTGHIGLPYTTYLADLKANSNKSSVQTTAIASLPAGPGTGINNNATNISLGGALLSAIGDTTDGNNLISTNNGFAGTVALNMSILNTSRNPYDPTKYDLVSTVAHEVNEVLGIGGQGSQIPKSGSVTDIGPLDLFRYSASGVHSFSNSSSVSSYFSIDGGNTSLVHFNQDPNGDFADWGDGVIPADGSGNTPPQVQDAFGDTTAQANMGASEAIALNAVGWNLTPAGLALENTPEPASAGLLATGALAVLARRRRRA